MNCPNDSTTAIAVLRDKSAKAKVKPNWNLTVQPFRLDIHLSPP
jgi:hypothetical protein